MNEYYYYLGLIAADGYLTRHGVGLDLCEKDIIFACAKHFKCHEPKQHGNLWRVLISDKELRQTIVNKRIRTPYKKDMVWPSIPKKYTNHFIRGYFDGDGSATLEDNGRGTIRTRANIRGPKLFLEGLHKHIGIGGINHSHPRCSTITIGTPLLKKFIHIIYKNSTIHIKYKHDRLMSATSLVTGSSKTFSD